MRIFPSYGRENFQYDPIDICGKNSELTLQSRVKDFTKDTLAGLLYKDRLLTDYPDKNTSIILVVKRKYGHYVLPLLYGGDFIGRVEVIAERQTKILIVKNIWYEDGVTQNKKLQTGINKCFEKFAKFNNCDTIQI